MGPDVGSRGHLLALQTLSGVDGWKRAMVGSLSHGMGPHFVSKDAATGQPKTPSAITSASEFHLLLSASLALWPRGLPHFSCLVVSPQLGS